jgi:ABC-2 type transport system ATP-binding protein
MSASEFAIDVRGVTKKFGARTVVNDIAMQVRPGEIYGFLGPNGSGKTTFLRMLCGLLKPDAGSGNCLGFDFRRESAQIKERVGYMTQKFSFYEDLTIEENLDFIARLYEVPQRKAAVEKSLERLGMTERRRQLAGTLSGGWKQRLALAACLIHKPKLLLLDRGRGPEGAARFLGGDSQTGRRGTHLSHHNPLHGRGVALPSARLHRLRQPARQRHGGRGRESRRADHLGGHG